MSESSRRFSALRGPEALPDDIRRSTYGEDRERGLHVKGLRAALDPNGGTDDGVLAKLPADKPVLIVGDGDV